MTRPAVLVLAFAGLAAASAADPPAATTRDVVYFAKAGPLRVRFTVALDGKPADAAWQAAVEKLFAFCDRDGNGTLDADERKVLAPAARPNRAVVEFDEDAPTPSGLQVFAAKDPPADKAAFAAKLRAAKLGPVEVTLRPAGTDAQPLTNALFGHLDRDADGKLSAGELSAAADRLAALDLNEDELITGPELLGRVAAAAGNGLVPAIPRQEEPEEDATNEDLLPLPTGSAAAVKAVIQKRDADKTGSLSRAEFGADPKAFAGLDKDGNAQLDSDEVAAWLRSPPDLECAVAVGGPKAAGGEGPARPFGDARVRLTTVGGNPADDWKRSADRMRFTFLRLAKDRKAVEKKQTEDAADRDAGVLRPVFDFADRNADKSLTKDELDAAVEVLGLVAACRVEVTLADQGRGLFELIDRSGDGQLSLRELRAAADLLKTLGGGGRLDKGDVPRLFPVTAAAVGIGVVAAPPQRIVNRAMGQERPAGAADGPGWFTKMDRNGDGDVSRREFLGPIALFRKLDRDGDGLLSPAEAK